MKLKYTHYLKNILSRQKQQNLDKVDITLLDAMLDEWGKLAKYYEDNIYTEPAEGHSFDLQMRISIVGEYFDLVSVLNSYRVSAIRNGDLEKGEELEELLESIEYYMAKIIKAARIREGLI